MEKLTKVWNKRRKTHFNLAERGLKRLGGVLGCFGCVWRPLGSALGGLGGTLEAVLAVLEASWTLRSHVNNGNILPPGAHWGPMRALHGTQFGPSLGTNHYPIRRTVTLSPPVESPR